MTNLVALALAVLLGGLLVPGMSNAAEMFDLDGATRRAMTHNPAVIAAQAQVAAAEAQQRQSALILSSNPELEAAAGPRDAERTTADYSVALSQQIEIGGQRSARMDAAKANLEGSRARLAWQRIEIAASVREAFGRVLAAEGLMRASRDSERTAQDAMDAADKRFHAGDISRIDLNATRIERGRAAQQRSRAEQRAVLAVSELHLLLALPPSEDVVARGDLSALSTQATGASPAITGDTVAARPDILAAQAELDAARAESRLASREWLPKPRIGASYSHEEGADIVQGLVGVDLPVFNRNQAARGAATAREIQAEQTLQALQRRAEREVKLAHQRVRIAEDAASAYAGEIVTAARENLDLSNRAYQAGQLEVSQLLLIRREALEAQREYFEALEELNAAHAQLHRAMGAE